MCHKLISSLAIGLATTAIAANAPVFLCSKIPTSAELLPTADGFQLKMNAIMGQGVDGPSLGTELGVVPEGMGYSLTASFPSSACVFNNKTFRCDSQDASLEINGVAVPVSDFSVESNLIEATEPTLSDPDRSTTLEISAVSADYTHSGSQDIEFPFSYPAR